MRTVFEAFLEYLTKSVACWGLLTVGVFYLRVIASMSLLVGRASDGSKDSGNPNPARPIGHDGGAGPNRVAGRKTQFGDGYSSSDVSFGKPDAIVHTYCQNED